MRKGYLEPNIINWARRSNWTGFELRNRLAGQGLEPHFGLHGIYELARGLLSTENAGDAQSNFRILSELDPILGRTPDVLFAKEVDLLRTGATVIPVLNALDRASAKYQVYAMAAGRIEREGVELITSRQAAFRRDYGRYIRHQISEVGAMINAGVGRPKTFKEVLIILGPHIPTMIRQLLRKRVTVSEAKAITSKLDTFPAIRSALRSNLYLWSIPWINNTGASRDKTDDLRHVIEASYSDVLITGDHGLAKAVPHIHSDLAVVSWNAIGAEPRGN